MQESPREGSRPAGLRLPGKETVLPLNPDAEIPDTLAETFANSPHALYPDCLASVLVGFQVTVTDGEGEGHLPAPRRLPHPERVAGASQGGGGRSFPSGYVAGVLADTQKLCQMVRVIKS